MRGYRLSDEDRLRRAVINRLLCHTVIVKEEISREFGVDFHQYFAAELSQLEGPREDGLVILDNKEVRATWLGRIFIRNLAMIFDPYLEKQHLNAIPLFSKLYSLNLHALVIPVTAHVPTLVVGAGISGLVCAYALRKAGIDAQVVESSAAPGGVIHSERRDDYLLEFGPQSFNATSALLNLCRELHIEDQLLCAG